MKKIITIAGLILTIGTASLGQAADQDQYGNGILYQLKQSNHYWNNLPTLLTANLRLLFQNTTNLMFQPTPDFGTTVATFSSIGPIVKQENDYTQKNETLLDQSWLGNTQITNGIITNKPFPQSIDLARQRATIFGNNTAADTFFLPKKYDAQTQEAAQHYSGYASGAALSIKKPKSSPDTDTAFNETANYNTLTAIQSLNNYNFSKLYASRLPVKAPDSLTNISDVNNGSISSQQLFQYLAMHKATDPAWYKAMQKASPFTDMRELLNFSAGIFMELHQMEQNQEQILATLSAQNTLMIMMEQQIQKQGNH